MTARPYGSEEEIRDSVCGSKIRHRNEHAARGHLDELRARHPAAEPPFGVYPCPFSEGSRHWHAGHVPSLKALRSIARVIRGLPPEDPVPHEPPVKQTRTRRKNR